MPRRWLFVRIRAAERALAEGRVDTAYAAATEADVIGHRQGKKLLDALVPPLLARARLHAQAGRYTDALADLDRLSAISRGGNEADDLRRRVEQLAGERRRRATDERAAYADANQALEQGRLESGRLAIQRVDDAIHREDLQERLDVRVQRSSALLAQACEALERGDVLTAVRLWQETCERHGRSRESDELAPEIASAFRTRLREWFTAGHVERLLAARESLVALRSFDPLLDEFERVAELCARGASQLAEGNYGELRKTLLRLNSVSDGGKWLNKALAELDKLSTARDALLASPLGLWATMPGAPTAPEQPHSPVAAQAVTLPAGNQYRMPLDPAAASLRNSALVVLVDGAGSSLIVPQDLVRIGRAGGSRGVEVPIPGDILSHHADILRDGEDYFLIAHGPVYVNRREAKRTLLRDKDRIMLGDGAKFVFRKHSARSGSAVLSFSHRCRLAEDVSQVILFRDTCLIGPQKSCHIQTPDGEAQVVLFDRSGQLYGREAAARGGKLGDPKAMVPGQARDFGDVRLTVKRFGMDGKASA